MDILISVLVGAVAGWLAGQLMKGSGYGLLINIILGIIGGFVGTLVLGLLGFASIHIIGRIITATVGAVLLIVLARALQKK